jgi:hypothetical protein
VCVGTDSGTQARACAPDGDSAGGRVVDPCAHADAATSTYSLLIGSSICPVSRSLQDVLRSRSADVIPLVLSETAENATAIAALVRACFFDR